MGKMIIAYIDLNYLYPFSVRLLDEITDEIVNRELTKINLPFNKTHLIIASQGESSVNILVGIIDKIIAHDFSKITLIVSSNIRKTYPQLLSTNILENCEVVPINYWLFHCMQDLEKRNIRNSSWNWHIEKGYFPTGMLDRHNRVGFLKRLYDSDLLGDIIWTFPSADKQKSHVLYYFYQNFGQIPVNFEEFFDYCTKNAFVDNNTLQEDPTVIFRAVIFPVGQYQLSNFTILSETPDGSITEKTWMTILNHHPFIMLPTSRFLFDELTELGFKTFNNYLPCPEYATVDDLETRWEQTIENIRVFPKILQDRREEISADIEHNYNLCINLRAQTVERLKAISPKIFDIPESLERSIHSVDVLGADLFKRYQEREKILIEEDYNKIFTEKYNAIKAEHWPEIYNKTDFHSLPNEIKRECKEVFNFSWSDLDDYQLTHFKNNSKLVG
jgi:hypothetical protein